MVIGDRIKNFQCVDIAWKDEHIYGRTGGWEVRRAYFALLVSDSGTERILREGRASLDECEKYITNWGTKRFKKHKQL